MRRMTWKGQWLAVILAAGCLWMHTPPVGAQDETTGDSSTNAVTEPEPTNADAATQSEPQATERRTHRNRDAVVAFFGNAELRENESADAVVAIFGSAKAKGKVHDAVVAIFGDVEMDGESRDAVAVMGDVRLGNGANANGNVVAVGGTIRLGEQARVRGDAVAVGGSVNIPDSASVQGHIQDLPIGNIPGLRSLHGLRDWFTQCLLKFRLLSPTVGWPWWIAGAYFLLYLLITLALPKPVTACIDEMTRRPATTLLMGLLTKLLIPLVIFILAATGVGLVVVPFIAVALKIGMLIGKAAVFVYLGRLILRGFGSNSLATPILGLLVGCFLVTLTYMVPVLSLIVFTMTGLWAIGTAVTAAFGGVRRETPQRPLAPTSPPASTGGVTGIAAPLVATETTFASASNPATAGSSNQTSAFPTQANVPEALALQRAGFWERMGAGFLDVIFVAILVGIISHIPDGRGGRVPLGLLVALAYYAGMWAWRGTTIGGIVLNLKVVRHDGQPMSFAVALVRAMAAAFSIVVLFLGFLWIVFDREKQGWHDKIAGTIVVRQPRGTPLLCL